MMTREQLLELRSMLSIAHHIPGRLRLKLDPRIRQHPAATILGTLGSNNKANCLTEVRLNIMARSLVLGYDKTQINPEDLDTFLTSNDNNKVNSAAVSIATLFGLQLSTE